MNLEFLFKGLILGLSVSAPVGPIGILCINRTLHNNYKSGLITGLGAASADLVYGIIAGLGLTVISSFLIHYKTLIQMLGLVFLFYLGFKTLIKQKSKSSITYDKNNKLYKDYLSSFFLTITNPATILFFIAVFASLGLSKFDKSYFSAVLLIAGVFLGSGFWWLILSGITYKLKARISSNILKVIDIISGSIIFLFGIYILVDLIKGYS